MPQIPAMNLPPESTPWGRAMQQKIEDLERSAERRVQAEANANQGQNGTLTSLAKQIISLNAAIASVIVPSFDQRGTNNYAISTTSTVTQTVTFTVPDGYTRAMVLATAEGMGFNSTATGDYLYVQANVDGTEGGELYSYAGPGVSVGLSALLYWQINSLSGGDTFPVSVQVRSGFNPWAQSTANASNIYALVMFLR